MAGVISEGCTAPISAPLPFPLVLPLLLPRAPLQLLPPLLGTRDMAEDALADESWWVMGGAMLGLLMIMSLLWVLCDKCSRRLSNIGYVGILQQQRADPSFTHQEASYVRALPEPPSGSWLCAYKEERLSLCGWTWKSTATYALTFRSSTGYFDGHCADSKGTHAVLGVYNQWSGDVAWQVAYPWGCIEVKGRYKQDQPGRISGRFVSKVGSQGSLELLALARSPDVGKRGSAGGKEMSNSEPYLARKTQRTLRLYFRRPDCAEVAWAKCLKHMLSGVGNTRADRLADPEGRSRRAERPIDIQVDLVVDRQFNISAPEENLKESAPFDASAYATFRRSRDSDSDSDTGSDDFETWKRKQGSKLQSTLPSSKKPLKANSSNATLVGRSRASLEKAELLGSQSLRVTSTEPSNGQAVDDTDDRAPVRSSKRKPGGNLMEEPPLPRSRPQETDRRRGSAERGSTTPPRTAAARPSSSPDARSGATDAREARPRSAAPTNAPSDSSEDVATKRRPASARPAAPPNGMHHSSDEVAARPRPRSARLNGTSLADLSEASLSKTVPARPARASFQAELTGLRQEESLSKTMPARPARASARAELTGSRQEESLSKTAPARPARATFRAELTGLRQEASPRKALPERTSRNSAQAKSAIQPGNHMWLEDDDDWPGTPAAWPTVPPPAMPPRWKEEQAAEKPRTSSLRSGLRPQGRDELSGDFSPPRASGSQRVRATSLRQPAKGGLPLDEEDVAGANFRPPARTNSRRPQSSQAMMV